MCVVCISHGTKNSPAKYGKLAIKMYVSDFTFRDVYFISFVTALWIWSPYNLNSSSDVTVIFVKRKQRLTGQGIYIVYYWYAPDQMLHLLTGIKRQLIIFLQKSSKKFDLTSVFILYTSTLLVVTFYLPCLLQFLSFVLFFIFLHFFLIFILV